MTPERWRKVEEIFQTAVEIDGAGIDDFLTEACGGDAELRREVVSLLAYESAEPRMGHKFQEAIKGAARSISIEQIEPEDLIGRRIGAYRVISLIGRGGMGAVYLAERDDAQFNQQVAVKVIKRGMDTDFIRERFLRERQILAGLDHPQIARLLDGGTTDDGLPYFVLEHVAGVAITDYCEANQLSIADRLRLFRQVCGAVQHAHQKLVVHRDLKPSNILVNSDGAPKLLDFGIAKLLAPDADEPRTRTEQRMLTPDYASPEHVRGLNVTTTADIYSLGVVLYELLTNRRLRQFKTASPAEIERAICETEPAKPSDVVNLETVSAGKMQKQLAGDLDNIVLMAMRKEPERRYQSVEQFSEDIRRHLEGLPVIARADTFTYRAGKFARRHKYAIVAIALVILSLTGGIVATTREARIARAERARAERHLAEAQTQRAEAEAQRAEAMRQRTEADLQRAEAMRQRSQAEAQRAEAERNASEAERARHAAEIQRGRAERRFAQVRKLANSFLFEFHDKIQNLAGSTEAREMVVKVALEYLDSLAMEAEGDPALQSELAAAYEKVGDVQGSPGQPNLGQRKPALESYGKALEIEEKLVSRNPHDEKSLRSLAFGYYKIANLRIVGGETALAQENVQKGLTVAERLSASPTSPPENYILPARGHKLLGDLASLRSDISGALSAYRRSQQIIERWAAEQPSDRAQRALAADSIPLISALALAGDLTTALDLSRRSVAIIEAMGKERPLDARLRRELSIHYLGVADLLGGSIEPSMGRYTEAIPYYRKSLAIVEELAAADAKNALARSDRIWIYRNLGIALRETDSVESVELLKKVIELSNPSARSSRMPQGLGADSYIELAKSQWRKGDREEARQNLQHARQALVNASPRDMARIGVHLHTFYISIGELLLQMGDAPGALEYYRLALPLAQEAVNKNADNLRLQQSLADCYEGLGKHQAALASGQGLPTEKRIEAWREAREWYQKSLSVWRDWPKRGVSGPFDLGRAELAALAIAQCDAAISRLTANQKP